MYDSQLVNKKRKKMIVKRHEVLICLETLLFLCSSVFFWQNTDAALLSTIGWPAFALHEEDIKNRTISKVLRKLKGKYGIKRYLRDGYRTVLEDNKRRFYKPAEIKVYVVDITWILHSRKGYMVNPNSEGAIVDWG